MKEIYSFTVKKTVKKQVEEQTDQGKLVKEVDAEVPVKIVFKRPNRAESEQADIVSAVEYSESIRKGILTKPLLERFYDEKGGFLSEDYEGKYGKLLMKFYTLQNEYTRLTVAGEKPDDQRLAEIAVEFIRVQNDLQALDAARNSLFQNTAEVRAQNKTIFWLLLFLTYIQEDESVAPKPFFNSVSSDYEEAFKEKRDDYDKKMEEADNFNFQVTDKMSFFLGLWYLGRISTKEDFKSVEDRLNPPVEEGPKQLEEEKKPEPAPEPEKPAVESPAPEVKNEES